MSQDSPISSGAQRIVRADAVAEQQASDSGGMSSGGASARRKMTPRAQVGHIDDYAESDANGSEPSRACASAASASVALSAVPILLPEFETIGGTRAFESDLAAWVLSRTSTPIRNATLRYRASEHGWQGEDFHRTCDNVPRLLIVARSTSGYVFGGFTALGFGGAHGTHKADASAFLFTLINPHGVAPTMLPSKDSNEHAVHQNTSYGALFGSGTDLVFYSKCHIDAGSYSDLGHSYVDSTGKGGALFTGNKDSLGKMAEMLAFSV